MIRIPSLCLDIYMAKAKFVFTDDAINPLISRASYNSCSIRRIIAIFWIVDDSFYIGPYWYGLDSQQTNTNKFVAKEKAFQPFTEYYAHFAAFFCWLMLFFASSPASRSSSNILFPYLTDIESLFIAMPA